MAVQASYFNTALLNLIYKCLWKQAFVTIVKMKNSLINVLG